MDVKSTTQKIFALRKEGKLEEALQLARPLYLDYATDPWVVKAFGWTLYDCIKRDQTAGKQEESGKFAAELQQLGITAEIDDILFKQTEFVLKSLSPVFVELAAAKKLSQRGEHTAAANSLRETVERYPDSLEAKTSLGWALYRLLQLEEANLNRSIDLMRDYCRLKLNTNPDRLHSLFLLEACKRAESWDDFSKFVKWWKTDNLLDEDWQKGYGKDGSGPYPAKAVKLATALYKNAKLFHKRGAAFQWMLPFVRKVVETTDSDWTPYYLARMTVWFEADLTGVKDLIVPLVRAKQREFWAWQALADCTTDTNEKTAFYARAVLSTAGDEDYKVDLYHQFALFLAQANQYAIASQVARRYVALQTQNGKSLAPDIAEMQRAPWFDSQSEDDLDGRLKDVADEAVRLLFKDHPWTSANFIEVLKSNDGRPPLLLLLIADKGSVRVKNRCLQWKEPDWGAAIKAKLFWPPVSTKPPKPGEPPHGPPLAEFYEWEPRQDGAPYDCAKSCRGVVSQVNQERGFVRVSLTAKMFGLLHFDTFQDAKRLALGDVVIVWTNNLSSQSEDSVPILNFRADTLGVVKGLYDKFHGRVTIREGNSFGFTKGKIGDIFISPNLVSDYGLVDCMNISGWALCGWNKKKGTAGWCALTIENVEPKIG